MKAYLYTLQISAHINRVLKLPLQPDWKDTHKPGVEILCSPWILCTPLKSEEINLALQGSDFTPSEVQRWLQLWASNPFWLPALVFAHGLASCLTAQTPKKSLWVIHLGGICLIRFTGWCFPEWQPWLWAADVRSATPIPLPGLVSFLLCLIYLGWHCDTQLVLILEMFSGLETSV